MGKLAVYRYFSLMFLIIQIIVTVFTFVGLYGGDVQPVGHNASAMTVYVLPLFIFANVILLLYWLIGRKWKFLPIPVITLLCCIPYIGTLYQFRSLPADREGTNSIKVATYNVARFGRETNGFIAQDILAEMRRQDVDIFCIQEYVDASGDKKNSTSYKEFFPYMAKGYDDMVIYSRYPIKKSETISFGEDTNNSAMWSDINVNGHTVRVFNVHLQTTGINRTLRAASKAEMRGMRMEENAIVNAIYGNYMLGMFLRSGQAEMIANEVRNTHSAKIVCGDFNDVPYSYVYNTVLGDMIDGFKECGSGWMHTFRGGKKSVRIDYIFHDESLEGVTYYKTDLSYSDHYPVFMRLKF